MSSKRSLSEEIKIPKFFLIWLKSSFWLKFCLKDKDLEDSSSLEKPEFNELTRLFKLFNLDSYVFFKEFLESLFFTLQFFSITLSDFKYSLITLFSFPPGFFRILF